MIRVIVGRAAVGLLRPFARFSQWRAERHQQYADYWSQMQKVCSATADEAKQNIRPLGRGSNT